MPPRTKTLHEAFWNHVDLTHSEVCWNWNGTTNKDGYGVCFWGGCNGSHSKRALANRISYQLFNGEIPDNLFVLHECDNPSCVNPDHLHLGTQMDNIHESIDRGRFPNGETHHSAKFSDSVIAMARILYCQGVSPSEIGRRLNMSATHASRICKTGTRKDV